MIIQIIQNNKQLLIIYYFNLNVIQFSSVGRNYAPIHICITHKYNVYTISYFSKLELGLKRAAVFGLCYQYNIYIIFEDTVLISLINGDPGRL